MKKSLCRAAVLLAAVCMIFCLSGTDVRCVQAAAQGDMTINECRINDDRVTVTVSACAKQAPASDDGLLYLFAEPTYSKGVTTEPIASADAAPEVSFKVALLKGQEATRLYSKFVVAAYRGGRYVPVSHFCYITNPEKIAAHSAARMATTSKKGLTPEPGRENYGKLVDMNVQHIQYNIFLSNLLGPTTNDTYPTVTYVYNGKAYELDGFVVAQYDDIFRFAAKHKIAITAVVLNNLREGYDFMIHPLSRNGAKAPYYMSNAAEAVGVEYLSMLCSFLASRYSNPVFGQVDNWVFGNEVSAREQWNYIPAMSLDAYTAEYAKAFRIAYTAIKSENANARVYTCIDQVWARTSVEANRYRSKDFLISFNEAVRSQGNIDWGVVNHPYSVPLTFCPWWAQTNAYFTNLVTHSENTAFVTMENLEVFTDYMCREEMLSPQGDVRSIILAEVGFCAAQGEENQAAAFTWAYLQAEANQYIDAFIVHRQRDSETEISEKLWLGVEDLAGKPRLIYDFFKNIDTPGAMPYREMARLMIGKFEDWDQVIIPR